MKTGEMQIDTDACISTHEQAGVCDANTVCLLKAQPFAVEPFLPSSKGRSHPESHGKRHLLPLLRPVPGLQDLLLKAIARLGTTKHTLY